VRSSARSFDRRWHGPSARRRKADAVLHVTNGDSAAETLRRTALGGSVLPWQDVLHAGPVPAEPRAQLLERRATFLAECGWGSAPGIRGTLQKRDEQLRRAVADGTEVVLWFEHDLYDQLQLLDVLALSRAMGAAPSAIVVDSFPGKPSFRGLGELTAEELETLWPARGTVGGEALETAVAVWDAFRAREPAALAGWAVGGTPGLRFLAPALERLLQELPALAGGLSTTERTALLAIADGASTPSAAFVAAQGLERAPFLGDTWFYRSLAELGRGPARLLETEGGGELPEPPPPLGDRRAFAGLSLRLTSAGRRVLRGEDDRVELLGIDRWVGGAHIVPDALWRWEPAERRLVAP
jgi:hypothetical protein